MSNKGFTLVELAIVIAIVAILAAVAIPRFADVSDRAEQALVEDMVAQLQSGAAMYTAQMAQTPTGFDVYVNDTVGGMDTTCTPGNACHTLDVSTFGPNGGCTVAAATITCTNAFNQMGAVTYTWNNGSITLNCANCT